MLNQVQVEVQVMAVEEWSREDRDRASGKVQLGADGKPVMRHGVSVRLAGFGFAIRRQVREGEKFVVGEVYKLHGHVENNDDGLLIRWDRTEKVGK